MALFTHKLVSRLSERFIGSVSAPLTRFYPDLRLMPSGNRFSPHTYCYEKVGSYRQEGEHLNKKPHPVASLCLSIAGGILCFVGFWRVQERGDSWFGTLFAIFGLLLFGYGFNRILDSIEAGVKRSEILANVVAQFLGEVDELTRNIIHMKQPEYVEGPEATENFKRLASEILQANPKKKKKQAAKPASQRRPKKSDRD